MSAKIQQLLNQLDQRIYKFIKDDGILDSSDQEMKVYKMQTMLSLAQSIKNELGQKHPVVEDIVAYFSKIVQLLELGDPEFESEQQIRDLLNEIRGFIKGFELSLTLDELDSDEDIPEYVFEAFEPSVDFDTGECQFPTRLDFYNKVLNSFELHKRNHTKSKEHMDEVEALSTQMQNVSLKLNDEFQVDLGDGLKGVANPRIALQAELEEMRKATQFYFEPTHLAKTAEVARVAEEFYQKRSVKTDLLAGELIIAASEALRSVFLLNENLEHFEATLEWQGVPLSLQRKPSAKNIGNLFIRNVGCYGHREQGKKTKLNILDDFEKVIEYAGEEKFKEVLTRFGSNPNKITCQMLKLPETTKGQEILKKLKQNLFLIFCAEIFRYFPVEHSLTHQVKQIPFAIALGMGLEMLYVGELELDELFDHDADLGLPTGSKILDNYGSISNKFQDLIERYQSYLEDSYESVSQFKVAFPQGKVVSDHSQHQERLQRYFGRHLK